MGMASSSFQISNESCEGMIDDIRSEWRKDAIRSYVRLFWVGRSIESSSFQARHGEINNRARKTERISVMDRGRGQARGGTLKGAGGRWPSVAPNLADSGVAMEG